MTSTMIAPNPNTTPNARRGLWDQARKGKASARGVVNRLKRQGKWNAEAAADLLDGYTAAYEKSTQDADRFRFAACRAFVIAAAADL